MDFSARMLAAGRNETPYLPFGHFPSLGRNVKPRKSNDVTG
jgi:hypothetical protein